MAIALKEGRAIRGAEAIAERPDGTRRWFMPFPTPLRDAEGKIVGGVNLLLDITDRKQNEQTSNLLAAIVGSSDDAIVSKNLDGLITSWNKAQKGYSATRPTRLSAITSPSLFRPIATPKKRIFSRD